MTVESRTLVGADDTTDDTTEADSGPNAISLRNWGISGKQGTVFTGIDFDAPDGSMAIVRGAAGTGKTSLLLSLAGRMRVSSGHGRLGELDIRKQARAVRERVAIGHVAGITDLEKDFTVAQHVAERLIMLQPWYRPWVTKSALAEVTELIRDTFRAATEVIDRLPAGTFTTGDAREADFLIAPESTTFVSDLSDLQRFLLEFALASLARTPVIVVDNIDFLRERRDRARAWAALLIYQELRRHRHDAPSLTIIASCEDSSEVELVLAELGAEASPTSVREFLLDRAPDDTDR